LFMTVYKDEGQYASLCDFKVYDKDRNEITYTPAFNPYQLGGEYTATVNNEIGVIIVRPEGEANGKVRIDDNATAPGREVCQHRFNEAGIGTGYRSRRWHRMGNDCFLLSDY
ncbi:MAG: hypothetical protein U5L04_05700, partial [Trueperaceae bacterium]|nr:hypothetical protein [Trueperaceae bacterium]